MTTILGLKFRDNGQIYYFDAASIEVRAGDHVLVKTEQGAAMAVVASIQDAPPQGVAPDEIKPILRIATDEDLALHAENLGLARDAIRHCRQCIHERDLEMKLVDVEVLQDRSKMIFYFTAPGRIDFRELVKDLVKAWRTRIELRQIGVRHETQMLGAIGNCGQMCCCARFIRKFQPVTIKMAKEQNLFLNPSKISGMCGRLLCCLAYEQGTYEEFQRRCPKIGKKYQTSEGPMKIMRSNLFRETLSVWAESGEERELTLDEWRAIAGETWTPYIPPQQQPRERPREQRPAPGQQPQQGRPQQPRQQAATARPDERQSAGATPGQPPAAARPDERPPSGAAPGLGTPDARQGQAPAGPDRHASGGPDDAARQNGLPDQSLDGDDGEIVAEGQPDAPREQRSKRKRKRKPKPRRPEGRPNQSTDSGE